MNIVRKIYNDTPSEIEIPLDFRHKNTEIIIINIEEENYINKNKLSSFFGTIIDFPERTNQYKHDIREKI